jgi:hypothetical protein
MRSDTPEEESTSSSSMAFDKPKATDAAWKQDCGILPSEWYRIQASVTTDVPWGYVCGYPTNRGDLYGGGHYVDSASATMTPQGRAIADASRHFGDGRTLPFTPCKKGYLPFVVTKINNDHSNASITDAENTLSTTNGWERRVACPLHEKARRKRLAKENGKCRPGEADPAVLFWNSKLSADNSSSIVGK